MARKYTQLTFPQREKIARYLRKNKSSLRGLGFPEITERFISEVQPDFEVKHDSVRYLAEQIGLADYLVKYRKAQPVNNIINDNSNKLLERKVEVLEQKVTTLFSLVEKLQPKL